VNYLSTFLKKQDPINLPLGKKSKISRIISIERQNYLSWFINRGIYTWGILSSWNIVN